jgi:lipopolysaccharide transport system ATP-binding protein
MSDIVIKVENLGKQYRLGEVGTGTISHDLNRWWARVRGKEDPFATIGEANDRTIKGNSDYVWSLKDINFEVKKGEALGIIGRNGAGKSTLLKILSKVTAPTTGNIKVNGRIASLLEVGTGFHPELTGRENIYLNGAILGMTKIEIRSRFDEIVDFSGVERYIDTPVKRYSSGMYVRLAFAVAAFLEPEILIVDEVLAVGDAEFQKKCLGRMKDVSVNDGRTVLFVSHNIGAIQKLCDSALLLGNGTVIKQGATNNVLNYYLTSGKPSNCSLIRTEKDYNDVSKKVIINKISLLNDKNEVLSIITNNSKVFLEIEVSILRSGIGYNFSFDIWNNQGECLFSSSFFDARIDSFQEAQWKKSDIKLKVQLPIDIFKDGNYFLNVASTIPTVEVLDLFPEELFFKVEDVSSPIFKTGEGRNGIIIPTLVWDIYGK